MGLRARQFAERELGLDLFVTRFESVLAVRPRFPGLDGVGT